MIGVHKATFKAWEGNVAAPSTAQIPALIRILGYIPFEHDDTLGSKVRWLRICAGLSKKELSALAACEEGTIGRWENDRVGDQRLLRRGIAAMRERTERLGISEFTASVVTELLGEAS